MRHRACQNRIMQIAVAHNNTDFDSLAAQFAVTKLFAGTRMAPSTTLSPNIKEFLTLYRDSLPIVDLQYVEVDKITHVFVVDCQHIERLDDVVQKLIKEKGVTYTVFDHHQIDGSALISGARQDSEIEPVGSCTAMLVNKLMERKVELLPFEATLLLIGIYEDTGCMTYSGTSPMDARSVAYLLENGADLNQVNNFINPKLGEEQTKLFQELIAAARQVTISGAKVVLSQARCERYIEGLATLTRRLLEVSSADAAMTAVFMRDRTHIVGRSDASVINVRTVVRQFGGDGHAGAASAVTKEKELDKILDRIQHILENESSPETIAADITIKPDTEMEEAGRIMLRYGQDGLVVSDENNMVGVVSKRDVDKALHHKLGHAPVRGFMTSPVISAHYNTPLSEIQSMMVKNDIGRVPILNDADELIGIVTRKEVLYTLYGTTTTGKEEFRLAIRHRRYDFREKLNSLDEPTHWLFDTVGEVAEKIGMGAYAVGGVVRDLYMNRANFDLDFVIEGSAPDLAIALEQAYPGRFEVVAKHDRFRTATLIFSADVKREVDLSTARTEFYEFPAALPTVEPSQLEQDLYRRDFTINALALSLNKGEYGHVIDFFNGVSDIDEKLIRILHPFSFIEDPTRIVRAVRFASRLGFQLEEKTKEQARRAISMGIFNDLGGFRLKEELRLILESAHGLEALKMLKDLGGGLRYLAANLTFDEKLPAQFRRAARILERNRLDRDWIVYLALVLAPLNSDDLESVMDRLALSNDERDWIRNGLKLLSAFTDTNGKVMPRSEIYSTLNGQSDQALAIAASLASPGTLSRRWIKLYLDELRSIRTSLSGTDLMRMGFPQGPQIKEALQKLHAARLDGQVETPAQEFDFVKRHYPQYAS
jgi:tRNA nucleotidyltransferase (CCA-adding enzyme)